MTVTHQIVRKWIGRSAAQTITGTLNCTGDSEINGEMVLANDATQALVAAIRAAGLKSIYLKSDIAATLTFKDAGGTSVGSIVLAAGSPYDWTSQDGTTNPLSDDVALINVNSAAAGTLEYAICQDNTPAEATVALTGTLQSSHLESGVVSGSYTLILTLTGATWAAAGAAFNAQRQAIINGLTAATSQTHGWNNDVKPAITVSGVVRTSATVVTVTLPAVGTYDISSNETVTATVPAPATTAVQDLVASPTVAITAGS